MPHTILTNLLNWHRYVQDRLFYIGFTWKLKLERARIKRFGKQGE